MVDAGWALQKAIYARLTTDAKVTAALGGQRVYDHVPRKSQTPYITFGRGNLRDFSTGECEAHEHVVTLLVWSHAGGRKQTATVLDALRIALHDQNLALEGHHLVNLRHAFSDIRRETDGERIRGLMRLRAVTEPLPANG